MPSVTRIFPNRAWLLLCFALLPLASCSVKPKPPVPEEKMQAILTDLHVAEAYSSVVPADSLSRDIFGKNRDSVTRYYKDILDHYQISYDDMAAAMNWYQQHPAMLDSMYGRIQKHLDSLRKP